MLNQPMNPTSSRPREAKHLSNFHAAMVRSMWVFHDAEFVLCILFILSRTTPGFHSSDFQGDTFLPWSILLCQVYRGLFVVTGQCMWEVYKTDLNTWVKAHSVIRSMGKVYQIKKWVQPCHGLQINTQELHLKSSERDSRKVRNRQWITVESLELTFCFSSIDAAAWGWFPFYTNTVSSST